MARLLLVYHYLVYLGGKGEKREIIFPHRYQIYIKNHLRVFQFHSHPILLQSSQWFVDAVDKLVDMLKVFGHLSCEHHVNDGLS